MIRLIIVNNLFVRGKKNYENGKSTFLKEIDLAT